MDKEATDKFLVDTLDGCSWKRLKGVTGLPKLRRVLNLSQSYFAYLLSPFASKLYSTATISIWEAAWGRRKLPHRYWQDRFMRRKTVAAIHALIVALVEWASQGKYTAKIKGVRIWRVTLKEVK